MLIVSYKASSSVMRPCQTSWVCFAPRQELQQGWGTQPLRWTDFQRDLCCCSPFFLDANSTEVLQTREEMFHHWFSLSLSCVALSSGHSPGFSCCAGVHQPWRTQQTGRQTEGISTVPATGKRSTWGIFPAPKDTAELPASVLVKFHWNQKRTGCTEGWNSWLPWSQCYTHLESLSSLGAFLEKRKNSPFV